MDLLSRPQRRLCSAAKPHQPRRPAAASLPVFLKAQFGEEGKLFVFCMLTSVKLAFLFEAAARYCDILKFILVKFRCTVKSLRSQC